MATKTTVGWLVLAFVLAVPAALFYQWQSRVGDAQRKERDAKVRIGDSRLFSSASQKRLANPIAPPQGAASPATASSPPASVPAVGMALAAAPERPASGSLAAALAALPAPPLVSPPLGNAFAHWRDPTLSPLDIKRIEEKNIEIEIVKMEAEDARKKIRATRRAPRPTAERCIELQGIVFIDESNHKAFVNGEIVSEGQVIKTAAGPVKVLSITPRQVSFSHKGRRFLMSFGR